MEEAQDGQNNRRSEAREQPLPCSHDQVSLHSDQVACTAGPHSRIPMEEEAKDEISWNSSDGSIHPTGCTIRSPQRNNIM